MGAAYYYPNKMSRIMLLSMEEVLGRNGLNAVLKMAGIQDMIGQLPPNNLDPGFRFEQIGSLHEALEQLYGPRGGRGLALRAGRACFKYGIHEFSESMDLSFRLLPMNLKLRVGAEAIASIFNQHSDQQVRIEDHPAHISCHLDRCPLCWGRSSEGACCHLAVGLMQEALYWMSGGKNFSVRETQCVAAGDLNCSFTVDRSPLD